MAELKGREPEVFEAGRKKLADIALSGNAEASVAATSRTKILRRLRFSEMVFRHLTRAAAILVLIILSGVIIALIKGSLPALQAFGFNFLIEERWNPVTEKFGALAPIYGTLVTSFITSISRDVFGAVPPVLREAAYGVGCTTWEVVRHVVLPFARVGVIGGVMLGLGRALGETMAVAFVIGNAHKVSASILAPGTTISATIANEFTEAVGDLYTSSLIALGLILFVITFIVLAAARFLLLRLEKRVGRTSNSTAVGDLREE